MSTKFLSEILNSVYFKLATTVRQASERIVDNALYHYTTISGVKGIIDKKAIWGTEIDYLNDREEYKDFYRIYLEISNEFIEADSKWEPLLNGVNNTVSANLEHDYFPGKNANYFVTSYSEVRDDLSQWRGYAKGGYQIGFAYDKMKDISNKDHATTLLCPCFYNKGEKKSLVESVLLYAYNLMLKSDMKPETINELSYAVIYSFAGLAPFCKNEKFASEREWRSVTLREFNNLQNIRFRESNGLLIPFIEKTLTRKCTTTNENNFDCINEIIVGPDLNPILAQRSLLNYLKQKKWSGYFPESSDIAVTSTDVPYRSQL